MADDNCVIVSDPRDIQRLTTGLPDLTLMDSQEENMTTMQRFVPVLSNGAHQLILFQNGKPLINYKVATAGRNDNIDTTKAVGTQGIEMFLDSFDQKIHLMLLYDDLKLARSIEFKYIQEGLEKRGEQCIYSLSEDDVETPGSIRKLMDEYGINTTCYLENGSLKFVRLDDSVKDPKGYIAGGQKNIDLIASQITKRPVRVVAHQKYQFNTNEEY